MGLARFILLLSCAVSLISCAYIPELMLTTTADFLNKEISVNLGSNISHLINTANISDVLYDDHIDGVRVRANLTDIKQNVKINWNANIMNVTDRYNFTINSKNINITLDADLSFRVGVTPKQKGKLTIQITKLQMDTALKFEASKCPKSVGFNVQVHNIYVNSDNFSMQIKGKTLDNTIIRYVQKIMRPRIPQLINNIAQTKINPLITNMTCNRVDQQVALGDQRYILTLNTTTVPQFTGKTLALPFDITFQNLLTNQTNDQIQNDNLPVEHLFEGTSNATVALSSNFINTVLWLIEDANLLKATVTNEMLGEDPPILLNTTNMSILMPKLKQWPNKQMFLMIEPAGKYSSLLIRSGRMISSLSLAIKFVVNNTGVPGENETVCINNGRCIVACELNMTLPLSAAIKIERNLLMGLIHSLSFYQISIMSSQIEINLKTLKSIINSIVGSMVPSINSDLQAGKDLSDVIGKAGKKFNLTSISMRTSLDYIGMGLRFDF